MLSANALYDWDRWFRRGRLVLRRGEHFHCSLGAMAQQVRNAASHRGLRVNIIEGDGQLTVLVSLPRSMEAV